MSVTKQEREELSKLFEAVKDAASPMLGADPYHGGNYKQAWKEYDAACLALDAALTREEPQREPAKPDPAASRGTPVSPLCEPLNGGGSRKNCQTGYAMRCARTDGVVCPEDSCGIDDGIYPKPQPVACQHRELLRECAGAIRVRGGEAFLLDRIATALAQPCAAQGDESARWALIVNTIGQNSYEVSIERGFEYELRWDGVYRRRAGGGA